MVRAEELHLEKLITSVPEDFRVELRKVVDRDKKLGCNPIDSVSQLVSTINLPKVSAEKKMELLQEATAKKRKKEDARQKALVKVLSAGYPETERLLEIVVKRFGRQKSEATARLVFNLADLAVQKLTKEQLDEILDTIQQKYNISLR